MIVGLGGMAREDPPPRLAEAGRKLEMAEVEVYTSRWCGYCNRVKALLQAKGVEFREIDISSDLERQREMIERSRRRTVPQVFIGGRAVGGYEDLARLEARGELDGLLARDRGSPPISEE